MNQVGTFFLTLAGGYAVGSPATKPSQWGLGRISALRERYNIPVGFSDHSGDIAACLAATALGAETVNWPDAL